jgi:LmbE family N-acetylglucosaminyl deacetylase
MSKTILAIGAHYDDCVFGIPGILLKAARKGCKVTVLSVIGDYTNWAPVGEERQNVLIEGTQKLGRDRGVEMRFLDYRSMGIPLDDTSKRAVCEVVAEVQPDLGFMLWPRDTHPDHEVVSQLSKIAFNWSAAVLDKPGARRPSRLYHYDNGPRHTIGFEPDTFVDISDIWSDAASWLGMLMALVLGEESRSVGAAVQAKEAIAAFRGKACGVEYAAGLKSFNSYPTEIL